MKKQRFLSFLLSFAVVLFAATSCSDDDDDVKIAELTSFQITSPISAVGVIDNTAQTVTLTVPYGTELTNVQGTATINDGATISPDISAGVDFSNLSVDFTVTNGDVVTVYTVQVIVGANPLRVALVGAEENMEDLHSEIKTAYQWAIDTYGNKAEYIPFSELTAESIETANVVWFQLLDTVNMAIPAEAEGEALSVLTDYYKAGGNVLLSTHASNYLINLGRISEDYGPTGGGNGANWNENGDNWGISYSKINDTVDWYASGNEDHELFQGLTTSDVSFEGFTYPAIYLVDGGYKKDASLLWDFNWVTPIVDATPEPAVNQRKELFETTTNSVVRASFEWDPAANGVELGTIIEWNPDGAYQGIALSISLGAYEWYYQDGDDNTWEGNVKGLTQNALNYLGAQD